MPYARTLALLSAIGVLVAFTPPVFADGLININTADATTLANALPGIGTVKAQAIVDYRTQHGPFATTADIQNVSGIGPATYAEIKDLITVGDTGTGTNAGTSATTTSTAAPASASSSGGSMHTKPSTLSIDIGGDTSATLHTPLHFTAVVKSGSATDAYAKVVWGFGDGASGEGYAASATYDYPGTYLVTAAATDGAARAEAMATVTVTEASVRIAAVSAAGIALANDASTPLDLSGWMLVAGAHNFRIPPGTMLAPGAAVTFPPSATKLVSDETAILAYPDGTIAATYSSAAHDATQSTAQPSTGHVSYQRVQTVESVPAVTSPNQNDHAVSAVGAGTDTGPAVTATTSLAAAVAADPPATGAGFLHSGWMLGLLAVAVFAGGTVMIL